MTKVNTGKKTGKNTEPKNLKKAQKGQANTLQIKMTPVPKMRLGISSVQESVPIHAIHEQYNLIEVYPGYFTKSYALKEINYSTSTEEEQIRILEGWRSVFNSLGDVCISQTTFNRAVNLSRFCDEILLKESGDDLDEMRRQMNNVTLGRMKNGTNGIKQEKIITLGVECTDVKSAAETFKRLDTDINSSLGKLESEATPISLEYRLETLHDIYNHGHEGEFLIKTKIMDEDGQVDTVNSFDMANIRAMGLSVADAIAPSYMDFEPSYIRIGNKYARVMQITDYPNSLKDSFYNTLSNQSFNMVTTLNCRPMPPALAKDIVSRQFALIREQKLNAIKYNRKNEAPEDMLPQPILDREEEIAKLQEDINKNDERLFETSVTILLFADTLEELENNTQVIITEGRKASVVINTITDLQEEGFITALPLCYDLSYKKRTLKTTSVSLLVPFANMEMGDPDGICYSCNAISKSLVMYNRISPKNLSYNGFILGIPGSGKSFAAKQEMISMRLKGIDVIVIDPEGEYGRLAQLMGGQLVKIAPGQQNCINPLDIVVDYGSDETDPVLEKADFILKLCEIITATPWGLDSVQKTIIDDCIHQLYAPFYDDNHILRPISKEEMPTLTDLQNLLAKRREPEARTISYALKLYSGDSSLNLFGGHTNIDSDSSFLVYDILKLGDSLKPVAMYILMNSIWNRLIRNKKLGKFTYVAIDEFHLLLQDSTCALAIQGFWKRFRKFGGIPTGITQNIADLLQSDVGSKMLANSSFLMLLNQQADDRELVKSAFRISDSMLSYITSSPKGQGLLLNPANGTCVPFYAPFPKTNEDGTPNIVYRAITSDLRELKQYETMERAAKEA